MTRARPGVVALAGHDGRSGGGLPWKLILMRAGCYDSPAWVRSWSALSVRSQVKESPVRPKWP